jgi:hypothetical protein
MRPSKTTPRQRVAEALNVAIRSGAVDGAHHKAWVIDQMVRALCGCPMVEAVGTDYKGKPYIYSRRGENDAYLWFVARAKAGEDGPETYAWDEGIPP